MACGGSVFASFTACPYPQPRVGPTSPSPSSCNLRSDFTLMSRSSTSSSYSLPECRSVGLLAIYSHVAPTNKSKGSRSSFASAMDRASKNGTSLLTRASATDHAVSKSTMSSVTSSNFDASSSVREMLPKIDKSGRFCSPRAGRELAMSIAYAACLEGSDPVRLLDKRINARREPDYEFDKATLSEYNHMTFGGPPVTAESLEDEQRLLQLDQKESAIEAEVLAAPPKLVYSKLILRFTRKLLVAVSEKWDDHVLVINKIAPSNWKTEPAGRILEFCILHLAMAEISVLGTRHQIVINEAVDLAKRFCDGAAPRIVNGCLRTFVKDLAGATSAGALQSQKLEEEIYLNYQPSNFERVYCDCFEVH